MSEATSYTSKLGHKWQLCSFPEGIIYFKEPSLYNTQASHGHCSVQPFARTIFIFSCCICAVDSLLIDVIIAANSIKN